MRIIVFLRVSLLISIFVFTAQSANAEPQSQPEPVQHSDGNILAVVLGQNVTRDDAMPNEKEQKEIKEQAKENYNDMLDYVVRVNASTKIYELVLEDYAAKKGIELNQTLVTKFTEKFANQMSEKNSSKSIKEIAEKQVMQFQTEKVLFDEFGGKVIFRQSNPQMPIDAYKALLNRYRENNQLQIVDSALEEAFWNVFTPPFQYEIAPENVDFTQPWWL
ncbi:hypothetical protein KUL150_21800 [Alteromonas sp. KUL150]|uniref:hypothetical protein n=1 Tax=Alteromonas sp. KUL150 TaxID=2480805 RepID=UPI0012E5A75F|nr:hypothetical protein [Alteromonas sp. KUL150]GFD86121.1 hypothetical protein KUL150_21800 [Alteromonas sp. KUL150]